MVKELSQLPTEKKSRRSKKNLAVILRVHLELSTSAISSAIFQSRTQRPLVSKGYLKYQKVKSIEKLSR